MKYTLGSGRQKDDQPTFVNDDAKIASNLIDILFEYIDKRIDNNNYTTKSIWKILSASIHHLKNWINKNDVGLLLNSFEEELKNRKK